MNIPQALSVTAVLVCASVALGGEVQPLEPGMNIDGLTGTSNIMTPELRGVTLEDAFHNFSIFADAAGVGEAALYEGTLMTRVVRSNETGLLTFNYRIIDPNEQLSGAISHIEISGYDGLATRVEYRNDATAMGDEGPFGASRSIDGGVIDFDFVDTLDTFEDSKFFFAMTDSESFGQDRSTVTVYLRTGESVSFSVVGGIPVVPTPGALGLLGVAGCMTIRRRR